MEFFNIITSFLSTFERKVYKFAKIHPIMEPTIYFNDTFDIETGLYHGEDMCHITIHYSSTEECKWDAGQIL